MIPGSVPATDLPRVIPNVAPMLVEQPPVGDDWLHEIKFDGYRMQVVVDEGSVKITSRATLDWTHRFPYIAAAFKALPVRRLVLDGEIISANETGAADFNQLQSDLSEGKHDRIVYYAFDLMFLDSFDLRACPLIERKKVLSAFLDEVKPDRILYSEHFEDGVSLFKQADELGLEGIVSKRKNSPYKPSRTNWLKVKCQRSAEYYILGFVPGGRAGISALRLGQKKGNAFEYVGKVGTGFTYAVSESLRRQLEKKVSAMPSLTSKIKRPDTMWVTPDLKAKIAYRGITGDGKLRHPSFKGLLE